MHTNGAPHVFVFVNKGAIKQNSKDSLLFVFSQPQYQNKKICQKS